MKQFIRIGSIIGVFTISQLAYAVDLFQTGETLTADKLNDIDQRIMALETTYAVGDIGPAGGFVFQVTTDGLHGLEAAQSDQADPAVAGAQWGCQGTDILGAASTAIGAGVRNTDNIVSGCATAGIAAALADDYVSPSGYFDWNLPSKDELNSMWNKIGAGSTSFPNLGGFANGSYWSSSEENATEAWRQGFGSGTQALRDKDSLITGVRAVRVF